MRKSIVIFIALGIASAQDKKPAPAQPQQTKVQISKATSLELDNLNLQIKANTEKVKAIEEALNNQLRERINGVLKQACADAKIAEASCRVDTNTTPWTLVDTSVETQPTKK